MHTEFKATFQELKIFPFSLVRYVVFCVALLPLQKVGRLRVFLLLLLPGGTVKAILSGPHIKQTTFTKRTLA